MPITYEQELCDWVNEVLMQSDNEDPYDSPSDRFCNARDKLQSYENATPEAFLEEWEEVIKDVCYALKAKFPTLAGERIAVDFRNELIIQVRDYMRELSETFDLDIDTDSDSD